MSHADEFKELHAYYTTRTDNPLRKMQSLIVIACKLLRVIYTILTKEVKYDPKKLLADRYQETRPACSTGSIGKADSIVIPEPCRDSDPSGFGQGSGKQPENDEFHNYLKYRHLKTYNIF